MYLNHLLLISVFGFFGSLSHAFHVYNEKAAKKSDKVIVFDMDDTFYSKFNGFLDQFLYCIPKYYERLDCFKHLLETDEATLFQHCDKLCGQHYLQHGVSVKGIILDGLAPHVDDYEEHLKSCLKYDTLEAVAGLKELLESSNARLAVLTNSGIVHTTDALNRMGLSHLFEYIFFVDFRVLPMVCKPDQEAYGRVKEVMGLGENTQVFFVDDNVKNVKAAAKFGWTSLHLKEIKGEEYRPLENLTMTDEGYGVISNILHIQQAWPALFNQRD